MELPFFDKYRHTSMHFKQKKDIFLQGYATKKTGQSMATNINRQCAKHICKTQAQRIGAMAQSTKNQAQENKHLHHFEKAENTKNAGIVKQKNDVKTHHFLAKHKR